MEYLKFPVEKSINEMDSLFHSMRNFDYFMDELIENDHYLYHRFGNKHAFIKFYKYNRFSPFISLGYEEDKGFVSYSIIIIQKNQVDIHSKEDVYFPYDYYDRFIEELWGVGDGLRDPKYKRKTEISSFGEMNDMAKKMLKKWQFERFQEIDFSKALGKKATNLTIYDE